MSKKNWYENYPYLYKIYETYNDLEPFPKVWNDLEKWFSSIGNEIPINELKVLIKRIPINDLVSKNNAKESLVSKKILAKRDFNKIWKEIESNYLLKESKSKKEEEEESISLKEASEIIEKEILNEFDIRTVKDKYGKSTELIFIRNGISYETNIGRIISPLKDKIKKINCNSSYKTLKSNILEMIRDSTLIDPLKYFYTEPNVIPFENGFFNGMTNEFHPIEDIDLEKYKFFYHLPFKINDRSHKCPIFKNALRKWLTSKKNPYPKIRLRDIFEMKGLTLSMNTSFKKSFILLGPTDTAKTQFRNILNAIVPEKFRSATELFRITKDRFGLNDLPWKILNSVDDMPNNTLFHTGIFKNITGGGNTKQAELKGGEQYNFKPYAKHWFNTNKLGELADPDDYAFLERFYIIRFLHKFPKNDSNTIKDFSELIINDKNEMQGIIQECLRGFHRLLKRGHFRKELDQDTRHIWLYNADTMYRFLFDNCIRDSKERIEWSEFKEAYISEILSADTPQTINKRLSKLRLVKRKGSLDNKKMDFVYGIKWKYEELKLMHDYNDYGRLDMDSLFKKKPKDIIEFGTNLVPKKEDFISGLGISKSIFKDITELFEKNNYEDLAIEYIYDNLKERYVENTLDDNINLLVKNGIYEKDNQEHLIYKEIDLETLTNKRGK